MIRVVAGIIIKNKKVLLAKRRKDGLEKWEFPGGKIEKDEKPKEALVRELEEELKIRVRPLDLISVKELPLDSGERMVFYTILAEIEGDKNPVPTEHEEVRWVDVDDIQSFDLFEPDRSVLDEIRRFLASLK